MATELKRVSSSQDPIQAKEESGLTKVDQNVYRCCAILFTEAISRESLLKQIIPPLSPFTGGKLIISHKNAVNKDWLPKDVFNITPCDEDIAHFQIKMDTPESIHINKEITYNIQLDPKSELAFEIKSDEQWRMTADKLAILSRMYLNNTLVTLRPKSNQMFLTVLDPKS